MIKIEAKKRVLKTLRDLDRDRKNRIKEALLILSNDPLPFKKLDVIKLKGYENTYRIRIGGLRIVYEVNWDEKKIIIHFIGPREKAYK
ncbi:MAG: type II toxin-antitoxin system RelE/ParE family toxin [Thaumarchaeota archaeon]|nr:type II toxin-antitoxin system RelE/ParE family toxin [Nitrososphaerota archaeon]